MDFRTPSGRTSDCSLVWKKEQRRLKAGILRPCPHESGHFFKQHIFYLDSCERGLKPALESSFKEYGFADRIHWFRVDRRPIRLKKYTEAKIPGYVDVASQGTDAEIEFL